MSMIFSGSYEDSPEESQNTIAYLNREIQELKYEVRKLKLYIDDLKSEILYLKHERSGH